MNAEWVVRWSAGHRDRIRSRAFASRWQAKEFALVRSMAGQIVYLFRREMT